VVDISITNRHAKEKAMNPNQQSQQSDTISSYKRHSRYEKSIPVTELP
jgi:hypothetical protein